MLIRPRSRRDFLRRALATAAVGPVFFSNRAGASQRTLKIAKWANFVPGFDAWFEGMARDWGAQHDTQVSVDHIAVEQIGAHARAEVEAGSGHDVFMFPWPPAEYCQHVIDHHEVYQTVSLKYGTID